MQMPPPRWRKAYFSTLDPPEWRVFSGDPFSDSGCARLLWREALQEPCRGVERAIGLSTSGWSNGGTYVRGLVFRAFRAELRERLRIAPYAWAAPDCARAVHSVLHR